jgi:hypothetical protein
MKTGAILALVMLACVARADQWSLPKPRAFASPNGRYILRVIPGDSDAGRKTTAVILEISQKEDRYEKIREYPLANHWAPADAFISDAAEVYTFDDWGSAGYNLVLVWYSAEGQKKAEYSLAQLIPERQRKEIIDHHSTKSSIWWRSSHRPWIDMGYLHVEDVLGGIISVDPERNLHYDPSEVTK